MEQREEWFDGAEESSDWREELWDGIPDVDARLAAWATSVSPRAAAMYLGTGMSLPGGGGQTTGTGDGWHDRAVSDVLTECYARGMLVPNRERVEEVAISVMPLPTSALDPDETGEGRGIFGHSPMVRWEAAVSGVSWKVYVFLKHGPSSLFSEGELLASGRDIVSEREGMRLRQRVDLLWRHGDGSIECVIVVGEPDEGNPPCRPAEDWRVILASALVLSEFGRTPTVHLVRTQSGVGQAVKPPHSHVTNSILRLARAVREARSGGDGDDVKNGFTYPISPEAVEPLQRGDWPGGRPWRPERPGGRPRR